MWCSYGCSCFVLFFFFRRNTLKLEGVRKLWGKEGYLPKKENKVGKENEPQTVSCGSLLVGEVGDPPASQSDQVASLSEEDKEKQQLASTLFIGLGSNAGVSLVSGSFQTYQFKVHILPCLQLQIFICKWRCNLYCGKMTQKTPSNWNNY